MTDDSQLTELQEQLAHRDQEIARLRRMREIEHHLQHADAVDVDTAALLIERRIDADDALRDADSIDFGPLVAALRSDKPFLFRAPEPKPARRGSGAQAPRIEPPPSERLRDVADEARATGRLADLLRYLHARRRFHQRE